MPTAPEEMTLKVIAHIHTAFPTKFGIPRQSGLVDSLRGEVIFTPEYRSADAVRGLEDFSHIWLVWQFSGAVRDSWSPTVRPPRLGGNTRMGVFATRSPFRPNPLGLSSVKLEGIEMRPEVGPVLLVRGADLMDGTPIYDIKPYIPYADCHPDAAEGFTGQTRRHLLEVSCPEELWAAVPQADRDALRGVLANDPRPSYQHDPARVYGMEFGGLEVHFTVDDPVLTVRDITRRWGACYGTAQHQHLFAHCRAAQLFAHSAAAGLLPVGGVLPDRPAGSGTGCPPVRPGGQDRAPDRCR